MAKFNLLPAAQRLIQEAGQATPEFYRFLSNLFTTATTSSVPTGGTGNTSLTAHGVLIGEGTSPVAVTAAGASGALLVGQGAAADPAFKALSGDATIDNTGALTIAANAVANSKLAQMAAHTLKGNNTGGTANAADLTVAQALALLGIAQAAPITNSLSADVALNNTGTYFDGPSVAQGSVGTWFVSGTVTCIDTAGGAGFLAKLWDGTTIIASAIFTSQQANFQASLSLSGYLAAPAGNLRISVRDGTSANGLIKFNNSGLSKDSTITAVRIA